MNYEKHKFNFFPEMGAEDFQNLKSSISNGFDATLGKIILFDNAILDGWNRYQACLATSTTPVFEQFRGNEQEAFEYSIKANQDRRHLTKSQLAAIAIEAEPIWQVIQENVEKERKRKIAEARAKQEAERKEQERLEAIRKQEAIRRENERIQKEKELQERLQLEADMRERERIKAEKLRLERERLEEERKERERIAREERLKETRTLMTEPRNHQEEAKNTKVNKLATSFGTSSTYVKEAKKLKQESPERFEEVKRGEKTISQVTKEIKIEKRKADIEKQKQDIANENLPTINRKFDILAVDPPWNYGREYDPDSSRVANPYPEMSVQEIKQIDIPAKDNAIMFLWTTHQFLPHSFDILKEWGFEYKATMVWNKEKIGMGYWLRMQCEFCLLAVKGKPIWDVTDWRDILTEPRRQHSRKPDSFYDSISKYFPYASKLEYFSREQREGWSVFGNDINKF